MSFSRIVYAVNWYNVAAVFTFIAYDFKLDVSGLAMATASFYIGVGLFQVPGGIIAAKWGARRTAIIGILESSIATILTAFTTQFLQFVLLRFFVGLGMALFLGPGVTLAARTFHQDSQGLGVGAFQSAFYVGGGLGLFAWSVLAESYGWRSSLIVAGVLGILGSFLLFSYVPKDDLREEFAIKMKELWEVLADRWLLLLSIELFGFGSGTILVSTFIVYYLEQSLSLSPVAAGVIGSLGPLTAILMCPLVGILYSRTKKARLLLFTLGITLTAAISIIAIGTASSAIVAVIVAGLCNGSITIGYLAARDDFAASPEYESLAVSWVNTIQMLAGFSSPVLFSTVVLSYGYTTAWLVGALCIFPLISIILLASGKRRTTMQ